MKLAAAGMLDAFGELMRRYEAPVRSLCARMVGGAAQGDDVAQEVFLEIWRTCGRYQGQGRFRGFLFTATRNRCLKDIRARPATVSLPGPADFDEENAALAVPRQEVETQVDAFLAAERRKHLERLVAKLPPKLRDAIWLRFSAELDYA